MQSATFKRLVGDKMLVDINEATLVNYPRPLKGRGFCRDEEAADPEARRIADPSVEAELDVDALFAGLLDR
jgi:hypothetical protein